MDADGNFEASYTLTRQQIYNGLMDHYTPALATSTARRRLKSLQKEFVMQVAFAGAGSGLNFLRFAMFADDIARIGIQGRAEHFSHQKPV